MGGGAGVAAGQPTAMTIPVGPPIQIQLPKIGAGLINTGSVPIILSPTNPSQSNAFILQPNSAIPWPGNGTLYASLAAGTANTVVGSLYVNPGVSTYGGNLGTLVTSSIIDNLGSDAYSLPGSGGPFTFTALHNYQSLIVTVGSLAGGVYQVFVKDTTSGIPQLSQTLLVGPFGSPSAFTFTLPINSGDVIQVTIAGPATISGTIGVLGIGSPLQTQVLPVIGQPLPVSQEGGLLVSRTVESTAVGTVSVLGTPATGKCYRLWSTIGVGPLSFALIGHTSQCAFAIYNNNVQPLQPVAAGQLVNEAIDLIVSGAAGASTYNFTYDIVNLPIFV